MSLLNIIHLNTVDSTNNYAAKLLKDGLGSHGTVILADEQTAGRGQRGNNWVSEPGSNLLASFIWKPDNLAVIDQFRLAQVVSLALREMLQHYEIPAQIKWPNDIYVEKQKIAGILIENQLNGSMIEYAIIGIGLNVLQTEFEGMQATSMRKEKGNVLLIRDIVDSIFVRLERFFSLLHATDVLQKHYLENLMQFDEWACYLYDGRMIKARITGVGPTGALELEAEEKQRVFADLKEIQFIL